jgi:hypothetical protein
MTRRQLHVISVAGMRGLLAAAELKESPTLHPALTMHLSIVRMMTLEHRAESNPSSAARGSDATRQRRY